MLKGIIFDLDDTLYAYEPVNEDAMSALQTYACSRLHISEEKFRQEYEKARREIKRGLPHSASGHNRLLYCQRFLENCRRYSPGLALEMYEVYWGYILEHMELREGAVELLKYCRSAGLETAVCTDLTAHIQHRKLQKLGIAGYIDMLVTSEEAGVEKPGEAIYDMTLRKLGVKPEETVFVGDDFERDVEGPLKAGMRPIWLSGDRREGIPSADSLQQVEQILAEYLQKERP